MPASWVAAAAGVVGALSSMDSGGDSGSTQTSQNTIDPRYAKYLYGGDGTGKGLLSDANDWYTQNKSGLNDQMRQGLNTQYGILNDPSTMAGYKQMSNLGSGLMGAPVAGNPFTQGQIGLNTGQGAQGGVGSNLGMGGSTPGREQNRMVYPSYTMPTGAPSAGTSTAGPFTAPPAAAPVAAAAPDQKTIDQLMDEYMRRNGVGQYAPQYPPSDNQPGGGGGP